MSSTVSTDATNGANDINLGLPVKKDSLTAFCKLFATGSYYGHVKYGIESGKITPEELIESIDSDTVDSPGFLLLLGYLIRNGLDVNMYVKIPLQVSYHIMTWIYTTSTSSRYIPYIANLLISAGSSFMLPAYGGRGSGKKTVDEIIRIQNLFTYDPQFDLRELMDSQNLPTGSLTLKWNYFKSILLDKNIDDENYNVLNFFETEEFINREFLMRSIVMYLCIVTGALNTLRNCSDEKLFTNRLGNMCQSVYMAINSQNLDMFKLVVDKGAECNYICTSEIIARYILASSANDKILTKIFGEMLSHAVLCGSSIDSFQLQLLSTQATVELIETIKTNHEEPSWKKSCNITKSGFNTQFANKKLRQMALDLNIDFTMSPEKICKKLEEISNMDIVDFVKNSIDKNEERVKNQLIVNGDITEGDKLERTRCNARSRLLNNPYSYNDARMSFYKSSKDGEIYCFTSDLFETLIKTGKNPYNNESLPPLFKETIKAQVEILKFLDLNKSSENRNISESANKIFKERETINDRFSEEFYMIGFNIYRLTTGKNEEDFRTFVWNKKNTIFKKFTNLTFYFSVDSEENICIDFADGNINSIVNVSESQLSPDIEDILNGTNVYRFPESFLISKMFREAKYTSARGFPSELLYRLVAFNIKEFQKKYVEAEVGYGPQAGKRYYIDYEENLKLIFDRLINS